MLCEHNVHNVGNICNFSIKVYNVFLTFIRIGYHRVLTMALQHFGDKKIKEGMTLHFYIRNNQEEIKSFKSYVVE